MGRALLVALVVVPCLFALNACGSGPAAGQPGVLTLALSEDPDPLDPTTSGTFVSRIVARALSVQPSLLVADEPVSALDVSVQASILNLLADLQEDMGFACLFITHDLSIVEHFCDRVIVMYLGRVVETGTREQIFNRPQHPYTQALLSAVVVPDPHAQRTRTRIVLGGDLPSPIDPPSGCAFRTRCPLAHESLPRSEDEIPDLRDVDGDGHLVACHLARRGRDVPRIAEAEAAGTGTVGGS